MSQLEVDKIIPQSGTTLTIGDSGDTITFGTGTTPQLGGNLSTNGNDINFGDNDKAIFGTGNDLEIYHNGSESFINDVGTGRLFIGAENFLNLTNANNSEFYLRATHNGAVDLYYDNAQKLSTTSTGVDVTGTLTTTDFVSATNGLKIVGNSGTPSAGAFLHRPSANTLVLGTASTERMRIDSSGNVGIGTSSPAFSSGYGGLHISSTYPELRMTGTNSGHTNTDGFKIQYNSANTAFLWNYENADLGFGTNNSLRMVIDSSGNVGIGTSSPSKPLHVSLATGSGATPTSYSVAVVDGNDNTEFSILGGSSSVLGINFGHSGDADDGRITYNTTSGSENMAFVANASEAMRIDSSGNLLVGTTHEYSYGSPGIVLHPIGTHGVTNSFSTAWSIPNNVSGLLFVQGGASGQYGGVSLFMLNKVNGFNATITQISGFAGDVAGYTSSWQLSGSNAFQLKHNIPNQTINYNLKFIGM